MNESAPQYNGQEIAIIGLSIRVVKAKNYEEFWNNLKNGIESILFVSDEELIEAGENPETIKNPHYVKACSILEEKQYFDAPFFGYTPREAELLNPQVRVFHECSWEALVDGGIDPEVYPGLIGVYAGAIQDPEWDLRAFYSGKGQAFGMFAASKLTGIRYLCTRLSYNLNLKGPSITMQTACSTSLVAIHIACQALLSGECDIAIAGGVTVSPKNKSGYFFEEGMIFSPDGHTRTFDANCQGTLFGEGCGVVILKPLADAVADNDHIYAMIKSSAVNNDGNRKVGFTAPSVEAQVEMMRTAYHLANIEPGSISYVETHGTATPLGDSIEFEALRQAFKTVKRGVCKIGSVKTNLGHIDAAAGIAGFIKVVLALKYKEIPPHLFFEIPNPELNIIDSPFEVNTVLSKWERGDSPLRAAVNSLGMGGTNAHIVLEEAPEKEDSSTSRNYQLILLSAKSKKSLDLMTENLAGFFSRHQEINLADASYTLQTRRKKYKFRISLVCRDVDEAIGALSIAKSGKIRAYDSENDDKKIIFMFPGLGAQYVGMGLDLYRSEAIFRTESDHGFEIMKALTGIDIKNILYPETGHLETAKAEIDKILISPAVVFIFEYALARLMMAWGVQPDGMIGNDIGEYVAACLSGVFSLAEALKIIVFKYQLRGELPLMSESEIKTGTWQLNPPQIPFISNVTGAWITGEDAVNPAYWVNHLTGTHRCDDGMNELLKDEQSIFIAVGPGDVEKKFTKSIINLVRPSNQDISDSAFLLDKIGMLWLYGKNIDWPSFYANETRHYVSMPTYMFDKERYWLEAIQMEKFGQEKKTNKKKNMKDWFYVTSWLPEPQFKISQKTIAAGDKFNWLIFLDDSPFGNMLCKKLAYYSHNIITVKTGQTFLEEEKNRYILNPGNNEDYHKLFNRLNVSGLIPRKIVHLWGITAGNENNPNIPSLEDGQDRGFYSLLFLTQAIEVQNSKDEFEIIVITDNMQKVTENEIIFPVKATVLGPVYVIPQECMNIDCRSIDLSLCGHPADETERLLNLLTADLLASEPEKIAAYRNGHKWKPAYNKVKVDNDSPPWVLKEKGVYLITGGLGGVGFALAEEFAKTCKARLVFIGRTGLPERNEWDNWLSSHNEQNSVSQNIKKIRVLEELGSEVLYFSADAADVEAMRMVKHQAYEKFGALNGIIHAAGGTKGESIDLIPNLDRSKCEHQFRAKIAGLTILDKLFKDEALDFCILTSSMTSFLGGWEYTAYTAANFFMDRFVIESGRWISINLDPINLYGDKDDEFCLTIPELYQTFKYILATIEKGQVLMSLSDLEVRIERASKSMLSKAIKDSKKEIYTGAGKAASFFPRPNLTTPYIPPTDEIETGLVEVCRELFGYDKIGIMDDFFELGGNSLTLIRFISEIQKKFEVKIHFAEIFNKGHIRELADYIKKSEKEKYLSIELVEQKEYYPLSSAQKRLYAIQQIDKNSTGYNIPWPIELRGVIDKKKLAEVFLKMIRRHESLRTSFLQVDGEPFQKIQENIEFEITYKEAADRVEANEIIRRFIQPFDFSIAPLLRVALIKLVENDQVLMIDIHHIICDWHAMNIFVNDFMTLYMDGELPTLNLQYKDYSEWQNNERQREAVRKQEEYWLKRFKGDPPVLNLPTDFPRSALHSFDGERIGFAVDTELMEEITKILLDTGTTLFMLLLAVYSLLLSIYTGKEDIVVGIPSAGRNHIDLRNIVGMFVNMLPMRNNPNPYKTFQQYLKEVKENSIQDFENQDYSFENLISKLNLPRQTNRTPLVETMLTQLGAMRRSGSAPGTVESGLEVVTWVYEKYPAKFELALDVLDSDDSINMWLTYSTRLFKRSTIEKIKIHFVEILGQVVKNPDIKLEDIVISHGLAEAESDFLRDDNGDFGF